MLFRRILKKLGYLNEFESMSLRSEYSRRYGIVVGLYSYGCFDHNRIGRNTTIGRYCSFSSTSHVLRRNHGLNYLGLTPFLYNKSLRLVSEDNIEFNTLVVEDDVWIGHNATILPSVGRIGRGAVVAAGAVVTKDVRPYAIVAGNPAREIKRRFSDEIIERVENSAWWTWSLTELKVRMDKSPEMFFAPATYFSFQDGIE